MGIDKTDLAARMKDYEARETDRRFLPMVPVYARVDGRAFHSFTRGMDKPCDLKLVECMSETTRYLVEKTNARMGYWQSDEISLCWMADSHKGEIFFNGRIFKMLSIIAAMTTLKFNQLAMRHWPEKVAKMEPLFDCRVFQLPNREEVANAFLWREMDATRNSVSSLAQAHFSHNQLQGKSRAEMMDMLMLQKGINWNDQPAFFKRGQFFQRKKLEVMMTPEELENIREEFRPTGPVLRSRVVEVDMPPFSKVLNRAEVIFDGAYPRLAE
jgi:tRNA(His) 5'-end guanylyltransferase